MSAVLDRDWSQRFATRFGGRLRSGTLTKFAAGAYNSLDPAGAPATTSSVYSFDGIALGYETEYVDNERILKSDYRVMVLRGTLVSALDDAVAASLDLGAHSFDLDTVVEARAKGVDGDEITVELVADAGLAAGYVLEVGTNVRLGYLPGSTTVAHVEALLASPTSTLVKVQTAGTAASVLDAGDAFASTALAGGADPSKIAAPDAFPRPGDTVTIPPPGGGSAAIARVVRLEAITEAFFTAQVRGAAA